MLVDNNIYKKIYKGNGSTTDFPIPFPFLDKAHIQVLRSPDGINEEVIPASEYTITGAGVEKGGTCTFKVAPTAGITIAIMRNVPITQLYAYRELDNFPAESHEDALAKLTMIDQQQQEQINRALKVPSVSSHTPEELMTELFQIRDDSQAAQSAAEAAQSAAEAAQSAAETCRDEACECASEANVTLESAITVIKEQESASIESVQQQEQASVEIVKNEGDEQAKRLEDIATSILISAASYNKSVSVKLTSPITNGETYTLPESMAYLVGSSQLYVSGNGVWFYKGFQYEEVGTDGVGSTQITFLQDLAVDDVLTFTLLANRVQVLTATNSGLINDSDGYLKLNVDGKTVLINASGQVYVPVMVGATGDKAGTAGLAPAAGAGKQNKPLTGGGNYADSLDCDITGNAATATKLQGGTGNLAMPVGAIYVQFSGQAAPSDLFGGTWSNVSDEYAGRIFRAEGGKAAAFGSSQTSAAPEIYGKTDQVIKTVNDSTAKWNGALGVGVSVNAGAASGTREKTKAALYFQASRYNSQYGAADEVRMVNTTIRIWKRTA